MKIINSIKELYNKQREINKLVEKEASKIITSFKKNQWHYVSRIKALESFALKLETGRIFEPSCLEDFFACTLVVENFLAVKDAKKLVSQKFKIVSERPKDLNFTSKESHSFIFDDLRIYAKLKPTPARPKGPINDIIFEIQIKTFLQHAWAIATHDLIYKSDDISWTKQRVAYQIKAMLENAEISIARAEKLKKVRGLPNANIKVQTQNEIRDFILKNWSPESLPNDHLRLIDNIATFSKGVHINLIDLQELLDREKKLGRGTLTLNLTPYLIIVQSVINQAPHKIKSALSNKNSSFAVFIPKEIEVNQIADLLPHKRIIRN